VGLAHAVSFHKGCYLGQEVVERIRSRGHVNRRLCGLLFNVREPVRSGAKIRAGEKEVGVVTSCVYSPALERAIALGYVHKEYWDPGTVLHIQHDGSTLEAKVTALPFVATKLPACSSLESNG
jgi:glycine cleavage system aminomethyltransferase T